MTLYPLYAALHSALGIGRRPIVPIQLARIIRDAGTRGITCEDVCRRFYPHHTPCEVSKAIAKLAPGLIVRYIKPTRGHYGYRQPLYIARACKDD